MCGNRMMHLVSPRGDKNAHSIRNPISRHMQVVKKSHVCIRIRPTKVDEKRASFHGSAPGWTKAHSLYTCDRGIVWRKVSIFPGQYPATPVPVHPNDQTFARHAYRQNPQFFGRHPTIFSPSPLAWKPKLVIQVAMRVRWKRNRNVPRSTHWGLKVECTYELWLP